MKFGGLFPFVIFRRCVVASVSGASIAGSTRSEPLTMSTMASRAMLMLTRLGTIATGVTTLFVFRVLHASMTHHRAPAILRVSGFPVEMPHPGFRHAVHEALSAHARAASSESTT